MRLKERVALVTGGGSGIGRCTCELFAREGASVIVNDTNDEAGNETVQRIEAEGGNALFLKADVTTEGEIQSMVEQIHQRFNHIDILFNNAGISRVGALHKIETEDWEKVVDVNLKGVYLTSKHVLPNMIERQQGSIINMSSCIAEIGLADRAAYAATKGAVLSLTKSMQVDYARDNIHVNALLPGTVYTPFVEKYLKESYSNPEQAIEKLKERQLSGELGTPEKVAKAALFLASDDSQLMFGSPLYIDGGVTFGKNA
ncbi:NAD(P)-dependent dehydrogenase (short-subunit alcohol dehydrogenase family) [Geomicrobium halophilum]|uniref:NAD(P)-dependent dehydrogenase (Short-subunit alcohol dehydrogenase family) n=1 Tax=Geomicrobium halophilum TaxID=549000 RepID=A0A841PLW7_9BACL|nr:glucose 1-dehydrogenase [Geomicrobium halophilum]MBB6448694.1 NAD(P)-dependent dehydrogenase (short-subunit alcohol dehydrogenase family) [Geomicrobium halophilum]